MRPRSLFVALLVSALVTSIVSAEETTTAHAAADRSAAALHGERASRTGVVEVVAESVDLAPGEVSDWIALTVPELVTGLLSVSAPEGTRVVAADADLRPLAGEIAQDGGSVRWSDPTNAWGPKWRVAKIRLEGLAQPGVAGEGTITVQRAGAVVAAGSISSRTATAISAPAANLPVGATSGWIAFSFGAPTAGRLTATAPSGTEFVAADGAGAEGTLSADRRRVTWEGDHEWGGRRVPRVRLRAVDTGVDARVDGAISVEQEGLAHALGSWTTIVPGPAPASIVVSEDGQSSDVRVHGLGSATAARTAENRARTHSDLQPTGRFARVGDVLQVTVPDGAPATGLWIGVYGTGHSGLQTTGFQGLVDTPTGVTTTVTATKDGPVYLQSTAPSGSAVVTVRGGRALPTFVLGQTTNAEFAEQLRRTADLPMVELVGHRVFADVQRVTADSFPADMQRRVRSWDDAVAIIDDEHNLRLDVTGTSHKAAHRVFIASPDSGAGGASAQNEYLSFHVSGNASKLFALPETEQWGLWHEIGHTYQTPATTFLGGQEVTVNVSSLAVQRRLGLPNELDSAGKVGALEAFFARPVDERRHDDTQVDLWGRLAMYDQLRRAFGSEFLPQLHQELRVAIAGDGAIAGTDQERIDLFATAAARVADRDLGPFFRQWALPVSPGVFDVMATLPELSTPIWENVRSDDAVVEHLVPARTTPSGAVRVDESVVVGQRSFSTRPTVVGPDGEVPVLRERISALEPGTGAAVVVAQGAGTVPEVFTTPVRVTAGNAVRFLGQADRPVMWLAVLADEHRLRIVPRTTYRAHTSWTGREYIGVELRSADDSRSLGDWSIAGDETAYPLAATFDQQYENGQILVLRHQQNGGVFPYVDDQAIPHSNDRSQRFRIVDDTLVRLDDRTEPVHVVAPAQQERLASAHPVFSGTGEPGLVIEVRSRAQDQLLATTVVRRDGSWSVVSARRLANGPVTVDVLQRPAG